MKKPIKPQLKLVSASGVTTTQPPRKLSIQGMALWTTVMSEYDISDRGGIEILVQACLSLDRAEECAEQINQEGLTILTKSGAKEHPLLKCELANRAFVCRSLQRLGLNLEVVRPVGRPRG